MWNIEISQNITSMASYLSGVYVCSENEDFYTHAGFVQGILGLYSQCPLLTDRRQVRLLCYSRTMWEIQLCHCSHKWNRFVHLLDVRNIISRDFCFRSMTIHSVILLGKRLADFLRGGVKNPAKPASQPELVFENNGYRFSNTKVYENFSIFLKKTSNYVSMLCYE